MRQFGHVPVMIILQIIFIILFAIFVVYKPNNVAYGPDSLKKAKYMMEDYPRKLKARQNWFKFFEFSDSPGRPHVAFCFPVGLTDWRTLQYAWK